ncbi:iron-siderophore ABC transporter substrate-binding protein [Leucobacter allii]|uniref:iron-siderophore ABC transporter substrate-binding protein n=1 Tax=Leucobacter allii TaxID=2932247 RepID=UPI001FCF8526|nr:iron-siderophore ABC transporter substrate-binding protein [Leucobacter allii]UOR00959.1 iron-siderophore ABC transporter substrate-binding protein [Leucobacter allii]
MRVSRLLGLAAVAAVALPLAACSASASGEEAAPDGTPIEGATGFPVTIEHAYGSTTIEEAPERVATVAWANHEVPLALGVVPVGMSKATWGDDDGDGVLPWVEDKLEDLDAETPVLFDETDGIDFAAVNETHPDVILAAYSGLTQEEYDTLSKIAPVVAYPDVAWGTSYEDMIRMDATALGLEQQGEDLIDELHGEVDSALQANPELEDRKFMFAFIDPSDFSQIGFYTSLDTRPGFLEGIGLPTPQIVAEESEGSDQFYVQVSAEEADRFADVDVFVTYGDPVGDTIEQLQADPLLSQIPAIAEGRIAILEDDSPLAASANPTPLSIAWGVDDYFALLAGAVTPAS